jgi:tetratricopeptide (TPR) repeat protein
LRSAELAQESSEIFYDFDIVIRSSSMGLYTVSMVNETGKKVGEEVFQHFDSLRDVPKALEKAKSTDPKDVPSMYDKLKTLGEKLYKALLSGKMGREVRRLSEVGGSVALRFRIDSTELRAVPWETIHDGNEFLAASTGIVISRIPPGTAKSDKPVVTTTPRLACILMRPFLEEYGDESRWMARGKAISVSMAQVMKSGEIETELREATTLKDIRDMLGGDKYEIVHIFSVSEDSQVLLAEGELISASALSAELGQFKNLRLVVLSSVWGRNVAIEEMGRDLVSAKIPGVLVMPVIMGQMQERVFLTTFYHAVGKGKRLDHATSLARKAVMEAGETRSDFLLPLFFMSLAKPFRPPVIKKRSPAKGANAITRLHNLITKEQGPAKAMALASLAFLHQHNGEHDLALENYGLAIPLFEESQDNYNLAVALNNTATILMTRREYEKALEPLLKCIDLRKELGAREETAIAHNKLGFCYQKLSKLTESVESYRSALDLNMQLQDAAGLCDSYFSLGIAYEKMGDLAAAADVLQKSVETAGELDDPARTTDALEYLGAVYFDSENYSRAKEAYQHSRELRQKLDDKPGLAITLSNLGNVELRLNDLDAARKYYEEALKLLEDSGKDVSTASCLYNLARVLHKRGEILDALTSTLKAKNIAAKSSIEDIEYMSSALLERIKVEVGRDKYAELLAKAQEHMGETG